MIRRISASAIVRNGTPRRLDETSPVEELPKTDVMVLVDAEADAEQFRRGYADGFEAGKEDGLREAQLQIDTLKNALTRQLEEERTALVDQRGELAKACADIGRQMQTRLSAMEYVACEIAVACVQHVLGETHRNGGLMAAFCASMVDEHRAKAVCLRVGSDVSAALPQNIKGVELVADASVPRWSCRLETENGVLEANLPDRLSAIQRSVMALLEHEAQHDAS